MTTTAAPTLVAASSIRRTADIVALVARIAAGLALLVFGLNGFLDFLPHPTTPPPARAMSFAGALFETGYMIPLVKGTEVLVGLLLVTGIAVPLALVIVAPVAVNIIAFHVFLAPDDLLVPIALVAVLAYLAWHHRAAYRSLFHFRGRRVISR
jgi:uncharacterized membrane protein YphA (DoxX/SURF4 family)